jgi:hypothetical protein
MFKKMILTVFMLSAFCVFSQNTFKISGKVLEKSSLAPLESATIYLTTVKDSTIVDYTISDKNGNFTLIAKKTDNPINFKISYNGYKNFTKTLDNILQENNLGTIELVENANQLDEIVLKGEIPPIRIKKDTLEFNAGSFKVNQDANVEALLKQLPGVEIDEAGKITVNGKEVNNILVNGKPFFGKDGKIATQNLPADMIDKVQITDTKTKSEELSGDASSSNESTINLTIQEDKNKGLFGKAMAGKGSDDRYESSLLFNYFKDVQKISVLGSSNNINSVGFSMDEIFDNMGGGRNNSIWTNDDGSFGINGRQFGGGNGITQSNMIGINYADELLNKKVDTNGSYYFNNATTNNTNRTNRTNLLPTGTTQTNSESVSKNDVNGHNISFDFEIKLDSLSTIYYTPSFNKGNSKNSFTRNSATFNEANSLQNENFTDNFTDSESTNFANNFYFSKRFLKKGRNINFSFDTNNDTNKSDTKTINNTIFYQSGNANDSRNQNQLDDNTTNNYNFNFSYSEPISDSLSLSFRTIYQTKRQRNSTETFDFNGTDAYDVFNGLLSNTIDSKTNSLSSTVGLNIRRKKFRTGFSLGVDLLNYDNQSNYLSTITTIKNDYVYPKARGYVSYNLTKSKSLYSFFSYEASLPSAQQLLPFQNLANPLNTIIGNPNLKPIENYSMYFNFNNYDYATRSGLYVYFGGDFKTNQVVSSTVYDQDFKAVTTYENVDKGANFYSGFNVNKSFKKEKRTIKYGFGLSLNYDFNQGLTNAQLYESTGISLNPRVNFSYMIDDLVTISPSYRYSYRQNNFKNYIIDKSNNYTHSFKIETTSYWPKKFVLGNDFGYNYNSNIADGFQKDFYLWNVSLGYNFMGDNLLAKVKVYDLLNQNVNATRTISPTAISDVENTVLQQYVMFSLTYKLEKFGGKKKSDSDFYFED